MKIKLLLISVFLLTFTAGINAQDNLSKQRKAAIDSLALEKVRDLSKYISIIGIVSFSSRLRLLFGCVYPRKPFAGSELALNRVMGLT